MKRFWKAWHEKKSAAKRSKQINISLMEEKRALWRTRGTIKFLLLGAGESGKSTFFKQLSRLIHEEGYSQEECLQYKPVVYSNAIQSMIAIIKAMGQLQINFGHPDRAEDAHQFFSQASHPDKGEMPYELSDIMKQLWNDEGVQECFTRSQEYQLNDSAQYYLNALDRISAHGYIPSEQDILRTSVRTPNVMEADFKDMTYTSFKLLDVGGQRPESKKWIHCFEYVTSILFVVDLSKYNVSLTEDQEKNCLRESMKQFDWICNNKWFCKSHIFVFFNKKDLFEKMIETSPLTVCFPEYTGANTYEEASAYIQLQFENLNKRKRARFRCIVFFYFTSAIDTDNVKSVYQAFTEELFTIRCFFTDEMFLGDPVQSENLTACSQVIGGV